MAKQTTGFLVFYTFLWLPVTKIKKGKRLESIRHGAEREGDVRMPAQNKHGESHVRFL